MRFLTIGFALVWAMYPPTDLHAQSHPPDSMTQRAVNEIAAYGSLVRFLASVDAQTKSLEAQGKSSSGFTSAVAERIGVSASDYAALMRISTSAEVDMKALDAKAEDIISKSKARQKAANGKRGATVDPLPPELVALQNQKDSVVKRVISSLDQGLSKESRSRLDEYLRSILGPTQVVVQRGGVK